jgi:hypothetical protein
MRQADEGESMNCDNQRGARFSVPRRVSTRRAGLAPAEAGAGTLKRAPRKLLICACIALCCAPALAAVSGTVIDRTTDKPVAGAVVGFYKLDQNGPELVDQATSDARGAFTINQNVEGPSLIRTAFGGVTYTRTLQPNLSTIGIALEVYEASRQPGGAKITKHMLLFEPSGGQMTVSETYLFSNQGKTTWNDPANGTLHFRLPTEALGKAQAIATAPGGAPIGAPLVTTSKPDIFGVNFAIKPGETRIDLNYTVPYAEGSPYQGRIVTRDENTYLIAPNGVTLKGDQLNDLGMEPQSQAHVYGLEGTAYKIELSGAVAAAAAADAGDAGASDGAPQIEEVLPHALGQRTLIVGLALGVLAVGFAILYRKPPGKERNERGRG